MNSITVRRAENFARQAHAGQFRRDGITPYINHPTNVVERLKGFLLKVPVESRSLFLAVGWLHDVLEDTHATEESLQLHGIPNEVIKEVKLLTKPVIVPYSDYMTSISKSIVASLVKICDMESNLADSPTDRQIAKYTQSIHFLRECFRTDDSGII